MRVHISANVQVFTEERHRSCRLRMTRGDDDEPSCTQTHGMLDTHTNRTTNLIISSNVHFIQLGGDKYSMSIGQLATFGSSQSAWGTDPPKLSAIIPHSWALFITTQPKSWHLFYHTTEDRELIRFASWESEMVYHPGINRAQRRTTQ